MGHPTVEGGTYGTEYPIVYSPAMRVKVDGWNAHTWYRCVRNRSLLQGEMMQPQFKQNNFYGAHQRFRSYKIPVNFLKAQNTNRTAVGGLRDRDEGEEFVYTLEKTVDNGGMPGTVRVFFPKGGGAPKITLVSF